ncbi:MAG: UbiA family prenyltransferase [Chloroflexi bacterium]|nr:UbiA family prenyltransferase [Chloroflexota bacterium]
MATEGLAKQTSSHLLEKVRLYWQLIKSLQTGLLLITGVAGFMSVCCPVRTWQTLAAMIGTLFLAISGSTVLNMVYDRDIDARMARTARRPLPSGDVSAGEALWLGLLLSVLGVGGALLLDPWYGVVVGAGLTFDVMVYTIWLKRRTPWSILWGGIAGGMPILAGRTLGAGQVEHVGLLLALAVLLWIPTHIMTYGIKHAADYKRAGVPTFANHYGVRTTRLIISLSTILAVLTMAVSVYLIEIQAHCLYATVGLGVALAILTGASAVFPSPRLNFGVFKFASVYMLATMVLIIFGA